MNAVEQETFIYRTCRSLDGHSHQIDFGRRNGRPVPIFHPDWTTPSLLATKPDREVSTDLLERICINLTQLERLTWIQLLGGRSIAEIARDQGVSRAALYIRIRGKDGTGGMVAKNPFVCVWWELRRQGTNI